MKMTIVAEDKDSKKSSSVKIGQLVQTLERRRVGRRRNGRTHPRTQIRRFQSFITFLQRGILTYGLLESIFS